MDQTKNAIKDFMSKAGKHDTTVHEKVSPAVTHETVTKQEREEVTPVVDKEIHQDHYHTSVQPVKHEEVLGEQHHHRVIPVEHRSHEHDNDKDVQDRLATEASKFRDQTTRVEGERTSTTAPVVAGEHIHHHVYETIQPVVNKQTIEPHVVHTTVPVHEVHHNSAQHHSTSALPPVSLSEFKQQGGSLTGREERFDSFEGQPRSIGQTNAEGVQGGNTSMRPVGGDSNTRDGAGRGLAGDGLRDNTRGGIAGDGLRGDGLRDDNNRGGVAGLRDDTNRGVTGQTTHHHDNVTGSHNNRGLGDGRLGSDTSPSLGRPGESLADSGTDRRGVANETGPLDTSRVAGTKFGHMEDGRGTSGTTGTTDTTERKPSLLDKLNPTKDSDGDGKKGFMK